MLMVNGSEKNTYALTSRELDELLFHIAGKREEEFHQLYEATRTAVFGFALSIVKNKQDAEDVLQETYLTIYQSAKDYHSQGKPMAWIFTITRNHALMKLREHKKHQTFSLEELEHCLSQGQGLSSEDKIILETALTVLDDDECQIITLHALGGIKHREIASLLDLKLSTVLSKYHRGLKKMRASIGED